MGWLPDSPDEPFGAIVIVAVLGAVALVLLGRLLLWVSGWPCWRRPSVNPSASADDDYVTPTGAGPSPSATFRQELEPEQTAGKPTEPSASTPEQKLYSAEQIRTLKEQAYEAGATEALGRLLGRQLLAADHRARAMELLFGRRGGRHQCVRPLSETEDMCPACRPGEMFCPG